MKLDYKKKKKLLCILLPCTIFVLTFAGCNPVPAEVEKPLTIKASEMMSEETIYETEVENAASEAAAELESLY